MEKFEGVLRVEWCNEESRSEGQFAFLEVAGSEQPLKVCRAEESSFEQEGFEAYRDCRVEIEGTMSHGCLVVEQIRPIPEPVEEPTDETTEEPTEEPELAEEPEPAEEPTHEA